MKKLDYITILRAIAILLVIEVHTSQQGSLSNSFSYLVKILINNGARGVQLFFILSAYTLFLSCNHRRHENNFKLNFYIRRFFRIAPLYYLAIVYNLWQQGLGPRYWLFDQHRITAGNIISNFTFTNGFYPYWLNSIVPVGWSITIEFTFYAMLPFIFNRVKNLQQSLNFLIITLITRGVLLFTFLHIRPITSGDLWGTYLTYYFPNQFPIFGLGVFLYFILYDTSGHKISAKTLILLSLVLMLEFSWHLHLIFDNYFFFGMAFILLILALKDFRPKVLFNRLFMYIGDISYTLYLVHFVAIGILSKHKLLDIAIKPSATNAIVNLVYNYILILMLSIIISTPLHYLIELPMQKVGKKIIDIIAGRNTKVSANIINN